MTEPRDNELLSPPQRLIESDAAAAEVLREYSARTRFAFGEARAWQALQVRRGRAKRTGPLLGLAVAALAALIFGVWTTRSATPTSIAAESLRAHQVAPAPTSSVLANGELARPASNLPDLPTPRKKPALSARVARSITNSVEPSPAEPRLATRREIPAQDEPPPTRAAAEGSAAPATSAARAESHPDPCIAEQRAGHYESALRCFQEVAAGNGVGAELALYEQARLESAVLGRPSTALKTLNEHLRRFPAGALASEAQLMKLGLLAQTGDERALAEVERALGSALGRERRGDLLLLRGNILKTRLRCAEALQSYDQAAQAGISQLRIERASRACRDNP